MNGSKLKLVYVLKSSSHAEFVELSVNKEKYVQGVGCTPRLEVQLQPGVVNNHIRNMSSIMRKKCNKMFKTLSEPLNCLISLQSLKLKCVFFSSINRFYTQDIHFMWISLSGNLLSHEVRKPSWIKGSKIESFFSSGN